jgi:hypothetical protein
MDEQTQPRRNAEPELKASEEGFEGLESEVEEAGGVQSGVVNRFVQVRRRAVRGMRLRVRIATASLLAAGLTVCAPAIAPARLNWRSIAVFDHVQPYASGTKLTVVGCASDGFCVAEGPVVASSSAPTTDAWTAVPAPPGPQPTQITCPTTSLCLGVPQPYGGVPLPAIEDEIDETTDPEAGVWTTTPVGFTQQPNAISCSAATFCVALSNSGQVAISSDPAAGEWTLAPSLPDSAFQYLSCPNESLCVAAGGGNIAWTDDVVAGDWRVRMVDNLDLQGLSCPTTTLCVALDDDFDPVVSTVPAGGDWSVEPPVGTSGEAPGNEPPIIDELGGFSCSAAGQCVAGYIGGVYTAPASDLDQWSFVPLGGHLGFTQIEDVTCAQTLCIAVSEHGQAFTSTDPPGGPSAWNTHLVAGVDRLSAIACSSAALCAAVDDSGHVFTTGTPTAGRGAWQFATLDPGHQLTAVTCTGRRLCVAVDTVGDAFIRVGGRWRRASIDHGRRLSGVACPSARLCVAVDAKGAILSSTDPAGGARRWHRVAVGGSYHSLSCPTTHFCAAQGPTRIAISADPTGGASAWTQRRPAAAAHLFAVSCSPDGRCVALADEGGYSLDSLTSADPLGSARRWRFGDIVDYTYVHNNAASLSCATSAFCLAVDDFGYASVGRSPFHSGDWTQTQLSSSPLTGVSCVSPRLCLAVDNHGGLLIGTS